MTKMGDEWNRMQTNEREECSDARARGRARIQHWLQANDKVRDEREFNDEHNTEPNNMRREEREKTSTVAVSFRTIAFIL